MQYNKDKGGDEMFKDRLKQARKRAGMTQDQVAKALRIAKSTYAGYETGNSEPDMDKIEQLMRELEVDANFLWQDEMKRRSPNFSAREIEIINLYRSLDEAGKAFIDHALEFASRTVTDPIAGKETDYADVREEALAAQRKRISECDPAKAE